MRTIVISNRVMDTIRAATRPGHTFRQTGVQRADGFWDLQVDDEVYDRIARDALPGETISDTLERALAVLGGQQH